MRDTDPMEWFRRNVAGFGIETRQVQIPATNETIPIIAVPFAPRLPGQVSVSRGTPDEGLDLLRDPGYEVRTFDPADFLPESIADNWEGPDVPDVPYLVPSGAPENLFSDT